MFFLIQLAVLALALVGLVTLVGGAARRGALPPAVSDPTPAREIQEELDAVRERLTRTEERVEFLERLLQPAPDRPGLPPRSEPEAPR